MSNKDVEHNPSWASDDKSQSAPTSRKTLTSSPHMISAKTFMSTAAVRIKLEQAYNNGRQKLKNSQADTEKSNDSSESKISPSKGQFNDGITTMFDLKIGTDAAEDATEESDQDFSSENNEDGTFFAMDSIEEEDGEKEGNGFSLI